MKKTLIFFIITILLIAMFIQLTQTISSESFLYNKKIKSYEIDKKMIEKIELKINKINLSLIIQNSSNIELIKIKLNWDNTPIIFNLTTQTKAWVGARNRFIMQNHTYGLIILDYVASHEYGKQTIKNKKR